MRQELDRQRVTVRERARAIAVERDALVLEAARPPADLVVWATGAAALPFLAEAPLPHDADGFGRVRPTLLVERHDELFAAGDCASLAGEALRRFRPQRDFLSLLNPGNRRALAAKWGLVAVGGWVWRLKDRIDRRFVERFRVA